MNITHRRKSIRLKGYDYSQAGAYFVTICMHERERLLGKVVNGKIILNKIGQLVSWHWNRISHNFENVKLDEFIIMPEFQIRVITEI